MSENELSHDAVLTEIKENLRQQKVAIRNRLYEVIRDAYRIYDDPQEIDAIVRELVEKQSTFKSMSGFFQGLHSLLVDNQAKLEIDYAYKPPSVRVVFTGLNGTFAVPCNHHASVYKLTIESANMIDAVATLAS